MAANGTRAAGAKDTRTRVLKAAAELFSVRGYGGTTLQAIADHARVSVETVGLLGPKRRLLRSAFDMAFAGHGAAFPAAGQPAYVDLAEALDFPSAVEQYVRLLAASLARTSGLWNAFHAAADADPKAAASFAEVRAERRREFGRTAQWLADRGVIAEDAVPDMVREFYIIASHETYTLLTSECGYTVETFGERLLAQVHGLIVPPVPA